MKKNYLKNDHSKFVHRIDALVEGKSTSEPGFGRVTCFKSAKSSKTHRRLFSVKGSSMASSKGRYTFGALMKVFGLHR